MAIIHVLPEAVQNKIAAGEVIERPASVVKELVENAIDAGATLVSVEMEEGGHRLIRVSDNGVGMDEDDLIACTQRHATSKIRDVDDIFRIGTFGFRGEALPSIGSVSRMAIASCQAGQAEGREVIIEAGKTLRISPSAPRTGTRVEVRDIFFNTPARRKFLSQPTSENTRACEVLTRLALGNPEVGFRLQTGGRIALSVRPAASQAERLAELFGKDMAAKLVPFANDITDGLAVDGFFARPPHSRRNSKDIYILVNKRWVRFYGLAKAVADAFQGVLPPREYPFAVVNLHVDPARVDVNAHPAKEEVRFEQANILISGVKRAIRQALESLAELPTARSLPAGSPVSIPVVENPVASPPASPIFSHGKGQGTRPLFRESSVRPAGGVIPGVPLDAVRERLRAGEERDVAKAATEAADAVPETGSLQEPPILPVSNPPPKEPTDSSPRFLGQPAGKYLVLQDAEGLVLVDPHALHERWNFDRLMAERRDRVSSSRLLLPLEIRLSPAEASAAVEAVPMLAEYGFEFELPEPNLLRVTASPDFIPPDKLENLLQKVLGDAGDATGPVAVAREKLLASLACRMSVLLGQALPEEEIMVLLDRFYGAGQMPTCPHGRPTAIRISWDEVARRFRR